MVGDEVLLSLAIAFRVRAAIKGSEQNLCSRKIKTGVDYVGKRSAITPEMLETC